MTDNELTESIADNAAAPRKVSGDAGSVEQHSLTDQIKADKYLRSKQATTGAGLGIKLHKITPDGTTD